MCGGLWESVSYNVSLAEHGSIIIIGGPPLETCQSVWRYSPTKRHGQYRSYVGGISVHHCSNTDSAADFFCRVLLKMDISFLPGPHLVPMQLVQYTVYAYLFFNERFS